MVPLTSIARAITFFPVWFSAFVIHDLGSVMPFESPTIMSFLMIALDFTLQKNYKSLII